MSSLLLSGFLQVFVFGLKMKTAYDRCAKEAIYHELYSGLQPFVYWHVTESIQEGYAPDAIGELQEEREAEALILERRFDVRNRALGHFVSLLQYYKARQPDHDDLPAAIENLQSDLDKQPVPPAFDDFRLETAEINQYIVKQKGSGGLIADDPAWHTQPKIHSKVQWNVEFKTSIETTRKTYVNACTRLEHRLKLGCDADYELILLPPDFNDLVATHAAKPRHIPAPPPSSTHSVSSTNSFWDQRIGSNRIATPPTVPDFEVDHLLQAGSKIRTACHENVRFFPPGLGPYAKPGSEPSVVMSKAQNPATNPQRLIERAQQRYDEWTLIATEFPSERNDAFLRKLKFGLNTAIRILGTRDGERNVALRVQAHNLRGRMNHHIASNTPFTETDYLKMVVRDWSASIDLDEDQPQIRKKVSEARARLLSLEKEDKGPTSTSTDTKASRQSFGSTVSHVAGNPACSTTILPGESSTFKEKVRGPPSTNEGTSIIQNEADTKSREKTILESPFFRVDLVTGLMVDSLLALAFPHRAFRETLRFPPAASVAAASQDHVHMLDRLSKSHQQTVKALTAENKEQLKTAIKTVSAVLALPDLQKVTRDDPPEKVLRITSLRLVSGTLFLLLNDFVKAQTELDLVSNALKPNARVKGGAKAKSQPVPEPEPSSVPQAQAAAEGDASASNEEALEAIAQMQTRVQGEALFLLAKTCWMANKVQEADKFYRWFIKWYSDQQAELALSSETAVEEGAGAPEVPDLDLRWWDKLLVLPKKE